MRVVDEWAAVDRWWTDAPERREYVVVEWHGREVTFLRRDGDATWRVYRPEASTEKRP